MKTYLLAFVVLTGCILYSCGSDILDSRYDVALPELPQSWKTLLGRPHWRIEWLNDTGQKETMVIAGGTPLAIDVPQTWTSAVSALPFWPERGISPGIFRPAGAIFPYDVSGSSLVLSWQGGVDATLFWELINAFSEMGYEIDQPETERAAVPRFPWNFNWPRFRQLFDDPSVNADIRADPWLADWHSIAVKIAQSGFDKRRLVPEARGSLHIPVGPGPWIGASPFAAPLFFESSPVFSVRSAVDTWVSSEGIMRCNTETWILLEWGS